MAIEMREVKTDIFRAGKEFFMKLVHIPTGKAVSADSCTLNLKNKSERIVRELLLKELEILIQEK